MRIQILILGFKGLKQFTKLIWELLQCCIATGCNDVKNNGVRCKTGTNYSSHGSHAITHFFPRFAPTSYIHFNFWFVHLHICIQCLIRTHAPTCFNNEAWESHWSTQTVIERVNHTSFAGFENLTLDPLKSSTILLGTGQSNNFLFLVVRQNLSTKKFDFCENRVEQKWIKRLTHLICPTESFCSS